jgi:hypothetical protein
MTSGKLRFQHVAQFQGDVAPTWHQLTKGAFSKDYAFNEKLIKLMRWCMDEVAFPGEILATQG